MAQHDASHSSKDRTILWIIIPATIAVSLLFTKLNHGMKPAPEALKSDYGMPKKEVKHEAPAAHGHETMAMPADTTSMPADTTHVAAPAAEEHAPAHH
ncbi:MAG: hypothetical protein K1X54_02760 [Flavobacteriales bacterium]|nr:hypothetical protein [Flavobacteriales bacterium]